METARTAGYVAVAASLGALITVFLYIPALVIKINDINERLKIDSDEFRAMADETWTELVVAKGHFPADRIRRQTYGESLPKSYRLPNTYAKKDAFVNAPTCSCNARNNCPAGTPGPPGKPVS
uniref:Nematode cuticle collagen N-terminal domain-containing protein n=1 Tax=Panagrolaimus sp. JU765 TaxID=591449 RepID=A0AC34RFX8_9BILA